jgi:hypothetical protein
MGDKFDDMRRHVMGMKGAGSQLKGGMQPAMMTGHKKGPRYPVQNIRTDPGTGLDAPPPHLDLGMYEYLPVAGAVGAGLMPGPGDIPLVPDPTDVLQGMAGYQAGVTGREIRRAQVGGQPMGMTQQLTETGTEGALDATFQRGSQALGLGKTPGMAGGAMKIAGRKAPMYATETLPMGSMARGLRGVAEVSPFGSHSLYSLQKELYEMVSDATELLTPSGKKLAEFGGGKVKKEALGAKVADYMSPSKRRLKGSKAYQRAGTKAASSPDHRMRIPGLKNLLLDMTQKENAWWMREHPELSDYEMPDDLANAMGNLARAIDQDDMILSKDFVRLQSKIAGPLNDWVGDMGGRMDVYNNITKGIWGLVDEGYKTTSDELTRQIAKDIFAGREAFKQSAALERMLRDLPFLERSLGDKAAEPWTIVNDLWKEGRYGDIDTVRNYLLDQGTKGEYLWKELEDNFLEDIINRSMSKRGGMEWVFNPLTFQELYEVNRTLVHRLFPDIAPTWDEFYRVVRSHGDNLVAAQKEPPGAGGAIGLATLSLAGGATSNVGGQAAPYGAAMAGIVLPFLSAYPLVRALRKPGWERYLSSALGKHGGRAAAAYLAPGADDLLPSHDIIDLGPEMPDLMP